LSLNTNLSIKIAVIYGGLYRGNYMPTSNYNTGFPNGVTIRNNPIVDIQNGNGHVFWVDSNQGSDGNNGNFNHPFATINYAVSQCTANIGDKIFVAAGHIETVSSIAGLALDVDGITIYFMGEGSDRATIQIGTIVAACVSISGSNVTLVKPRFQAMLDGLLNPVIVNGPDCKIEHAEYVDGTDIDSKKGLAATSLAVNMKIHGWKYIPGNGAGSQKLSQVEIPSAANVEIFNVEIAGDFSVANINGITSTPVTNLLLENIL
jgi:hypothetical protein